MDVTSIMFNMGLQVALIVVVFFVLYVFAWKPFLRYLTERQNAVMVLQEEARVEKEYANKVSLDAQARLQEVNDMADGIIAAAEETAKQITAHEKETVQQEVARKLALADEQAGQERRRLEEEMQQQTVSLAADLAAQFLSSKTNEAETEAQIQRFLEKMGEQDG